MLRTPVEINRKSASNAHCEKIHPQALHPGQSCITGPCHIVWCRRIDDSEWVAFSEGVDALWDPAHATWDVEGMVKLMEDVTGGCLPVLVEF